jgi:hypothetical protein
MSRTLSAAALALVACSATAGLARAADCGADPAVVKIDYQNIVPQIAGEFATYTFDFVATLQNVGNADYAGAAGAQSLDIKADDQTIGSLDFPSLAAGATQTVSGTLRAWSPLDGAQNFTAAITYKDGAGTDCDASDNAMSIDAVKLEQQLRGK